MPKGQSSLRYVLIVVIIIVIVVAAYTYFQTASRTIIGVGNNTTGNTRCSFKECTIDSDCTDVCGPSGICGQVEHRCLVP